MDSLSNTEITHSLMGRSSAKQARPKTELQKHEAKLPPCKNKARTWAEDWEGRAPEFRMHCPTGSSMRPEGSCQSLKRASHRSCQRTKASKEADVQVFSVLSPAESLLCTWFLRPLSPLTESGSYTPGIVVHGACTWG